MNASKLLARSAVLFLATVSLTAACLLCGVPGVSSSPGTQGAAVGPGVERAYAASSKVSLSKCSVKLSATSYVYNAKAKKPGVTVKYKGKKLKKGKSYTVSYAKGRKAIGTYKVTVKGKGAYKGKVSKTFTIKPGKVSVKSAMSGAAGKLTVTWGKKAGGVRYQIAYKVSGGSFAYVNVAASKVSKTLSGLSAGKTYTVKVRAWRKVGSKTYYGAWSSAKRATIATAATGATSSATSDGSSTDADSADNEIDAGDVLADDGSDGEGSGDSDGSSDDTGDASDGDGSDSTDDSSDSDGSDDSGDSSDDTDDTDDSTTTTITTSIALSYDTGTLTMAASGDFDLDAYIAAISSISVQTSSGSSVSASVTVAQDGSFDLSALSSGTYQLTIVASGYTSVDIVVKLDSSGTVTSAYIGTLWTGYY